MLRERPLSAIERAYTTNKPVELEGTLSFSGEFLTLLKSRGLLVGGIAAFGLLREKQKTLGSPRLPAEVKAVLTIVGSAAVALGLRQIAGIPRLGRLSAYKDEEFDRARGPKAKLAEGLYNLTLAILFCSWGGGVDSDDGNDVSEHYKAGHRQIDMFEEEGIITHEDAQRRHRLYDERHGQR